MTDGTVCPYCAVGCRLDREGDRVVGRAGPANPRGHLCEQGLDAFDPLDDGDRLTTPLLRDDGGQLEPVSWQEAIQHAAEGLRAILEADGPDALAFLGAPRCTNEENYLLAKLARLLGTNNIDNRARGCHSETTGVLADRLGWPASTNTVTDLSEADLVMVVGANPAVRQPVAFDTGVREALKAGGTLVHIDPHRNETTRPADYHLAPRPGTDALLLHGLCATIARAGGLDTDFIEERTRAHDDFLHRLESLDVDAVTDQADVDCATFESVGDAIAEADCVAALTGTGADRRPNADALVNLLLLTGNLGQPGTGLHVMRGLSNEQGAVDAGCAPHRLPGHRAVTDEHAREAVAAVWGVEPPPVPGRDESSMLDAAGTDIDGALVVGENPAEAKRSTDSTGARLGELTMLVVTECRHTQTTQHADIVLPAATGVEKAGTVTNLDRSIQRLRPRAPLPDGARSDFEILRALGTALIGEDFAPPSIPATFAEFTRVAPPYEAVDFAALAERSRRWPVSPKGPDEDPQVLYRDRFNTSDGRATFVPVDRQNSGSRDADSLVMVVGDRTGQFAARDGLVDHRVTINPADAAANGICDQAAVQVSSGSASIQTTANVSEAIRQGVVHLHASVADPLVRNGNHHVEVEPAPMRE